MAITIIALIIGLVIIAIIANLLQQHKEKQDADKRQEMAKYRTIIEETNLMIANDSNVPISANGFVILHRRVLNSLKKMNELTPNNKDLVARIKDCSSKIENAEFRIINAEKMPIPENEKPLIALIQGMKKYRIILRSEHSKGNLSSAVYNNEDKQIEGLQLRINVESQMRRGNKAKANGMVGSARQYYEKALATLQAQTHSNDFIVANKQKITDILARINADMSAATKSDDIETDEGGDNLDALFAPKKKW